ncbi:response regulator transcription factor [Magnetovibrio blakemorei]|uniref:Response regulatory domain-containing protein n=1 Tax=Magnetovibrio blakemorei TaxID=28181 RepID=A0A1E5Q4H5_9PROT|nr:response regulator [Magnetovibrio blakemorei]OEJ65089.1 hypothetical protein BEN30_15500 [Magnetovibrio blakemorei]
MSKMFDFSKVRIVLAEPNSDLRAELKDRLHEWGAKNVVTTGNMARIVSTVNAGEVDLIIADTSLPEGDFNDFVKDLRFGRHGKNPFLVVVTMVNNPSREAVHRAINSGTDHVLAKPFAAQALIDRIDELTQSRKRFAVTADYIGPDRRNTHRDGAMVINLVDVPNPLHLQGGGESNTAQIKRAIEVAKHKINEEKVHRNAYQSVWLLDSVMPEIVAIRDGLCLDVPVNLQRLQVVAQDTCQRIKGTRFAHVAGICLTLNDLADQAIKEGLSDDDFKLMGRMAEIIENVFDPDRCTTAELYQRQSRISAIDVFDNNDQSEMTRKTLTPRELASIAVR